MHLLQRLEDTLDRVLTNVNSTFEEQYLLNVEELLLGHLPHSSLAPMKTHPTGKEERYRVFPGERIDTHKDGDEVCRDQNILWNRMSTRISGQREDDY